MDGDKEHQGRQATSALLRSQRKYILFTNQESPSMIGKAYDILVLVIAFLFSATFIHANAFSLSSSETRTVQSNLKKIGWPISVDGKYGPATTRTVQRFQQGWTYKTLSADGLAGALTRPEIEECVRIGGRASAHFKFSEFKSKGNGDIWVRRELLVGLESLRSAKGGKPLSIISGYRDPAHNKRVGGADSSQHLYGRAADISQSYGASYSFVKSLKHFGGLGVKKCNNIVTHVDVRPGSRTSPTKWYYNC